MSLFSKITGLIEAAVGNQSENRPEDVQQVKNVLDHLGYFDFQKMPEPHGYITREMDVGIKRFQKDQNLRMDGWLKLGGETESALLNNLYKRSISDDIVREQLSEPTIPGTNIPDRGVPEGYITPKWVKEQMDEFHFSFDKEIEKKSSRINPEIDEDMLLHYDPNDPFVPRRFRKYRDL